MSSLLRGLLAALGAVMSDPGTVRPGRARKPVSAIEKAHRRAGDRKSTLDRLSFRETRGYPLTPEERADLRTLRLTRGKLARRMKRGRSQSLNLRLRAAVERRLAARRQERAS